MNDTHQLSAIIPEEYAGARLDQVLAKLFTDYSRTTLKQWIIAGKVLVNAQQAAPRTTVMGGEEVKLSVQLTPVETWQAQDIALDIVYQDEDLLVLNKPAGLVVHPGAGHHDGTLLNALLHLEPRLANLPRAGIVHRLDKDTSGLMVVACSLRAQTRLVEQIQARQMKRQYQALVQGVLTSGGRVEAPIGRHPTQRTRMAVTNRGKEAITHYRVIQRFRTHTYVQVQLETGRTHQIRVHMAHLRHAVVGDPVYGGRFRFPAGCSPELRAVLQGLRRQALHAQHLALLHPANGDAMQWTVPLPEDMQALLELVKADKEHSSHD